MKRKLFLGACATAIFTLAAVNTNFAFKKRNDSNLTLVSKVITWADPEIGGNKNWFSRKVRTPQGQGIYCMGGTMTQCDITRITCEGFGLLYCTPGVEYSNCQGIGSCAGCSICCPVCCPTCQ